MCRTFRSAVDEHLTYRRALAGRFLLGKLKLQANEVGEKSELSHLHLQHLTGQEFLLFMTSFVREGAMPACRTLEVALDH